MPTYKIHQLTFLGAGLFILGVFLPLTDFAVIGEVSYYQIDNGLGLMVVALAAAASGLIILKKPSFTALAVMGIWLVLLWPALKNMDKGSHDGGLFGDLLDQATDPLSSFTSDLFMNINEFSWGGFIFLFGLLCLTVGGFLTSLKARKR